MRKIRLIFLTACVKLDFVISWTSRANTSLQTYFEKLISGMVSPRFGYQLKLSFVSQVVAISIKKLSHKIIVSRTIIQTRFYSDMIN